MNAALKFASNGESKVARLVEAREKADRRLKDLAAAAKDLESFDDPADAAKVVAARTAVEAAKQERDVLVVALEGANRELALAQAEAARRETEARHAKLRAEQDEVGKKITAALVELGHLMVENEVLTHQLPARDAVRLYLETYTEAAGKQLCANDNGGRRPGFSRREFAFRITAPVSTPVRKTS